MSSQAPSLVPVPQVPIKDADKPLFASINTFVHTYMSQYDNSHDYNHILRVVSNTNRILQAELARSPSVAYDTTALFLAALLHDVDDHKYAKPGQDNGNPIMDILLAEGVDSDLVKKVHLIATHVSYTREVQDPATCAKLLDMFPELGIVQDADRLDAIGAVGIARCFSYGAAKMPDQPMDRAIEHFGEKLYNLEGMMKTQAGRDMAWKRNAVLRAFANQWEEEVELSFEVV